MRKCSPIPKSMSSAEAQKMLLVLNRSNLPAKRKLVSALKARAGNNMKGGVIGC